MFYNRVTIIIILSYLFRHHYSNTFIYINVYSCRLSGNLFYKGWICNCLRIVIIRVFFF